jgi:D-xylose transport system substrate-binding protein
LIKPLAYQAAYIAMSIAQDPDAKITDLIGDHILIDNGYGDIPMTVTLVVAVSKKTISLTVIDGGFYTNEQVFQT